MRRCMKRSARGRAAWSVPHPYPLEYAARSPSGPGRFPFKEEVRGSNPLRATGREFSRKLDDFDLKRRLPCSSTALAQRGRRTSMTSVARTTTAREDPIAPTLESLLPSWTDRKSTRLNSSHGYISYAVFCL